VLKFLVLLVEQSLALSNYFFKVSMLINQSFLVNLVNAEHPQKLDHQADAHLYWLQLTLGRWINIIVKGNLVYLLGLAAHVR